MISWYKRAWLRRWGWEAYGTLTGSGWEGWPGIHTDKQRRGSMNLRQIHHVAIIVSDYKKSRKFYVETLGFQIIRENYRPSRGDYKLDLKLEGCELELFSASGNPPRPSYPEACGQCACRHSCRQWKCCKFPQFHNYILLPYPRSLPRMLSILWYICTMFPETFPVTMSVTFPITLNLI